MNNFEKMLNNAFGGADNRSGGGTPPNFMDILGPIAEELRKSAPRGEGGFPFPFGEGNNPFTTSNPPYPAPKDNNDSLTEDDEACSCDDCMAADDLSDDAEHVCDCCGVDLDSVVEADVDVNYTDDRVAYAIDLPGVNADDIEVELMEGHALIKAERFNKFDSDIIDFVYNTVLHLDPKTDFDKVETEYENGVLIFVAPFREDLKPRTVKVKVKNSDSDTESADESVDVDAPKPATPAKKAAARKTAAAPKDVK